MDGHSNLAQKVILQTSAVHVPILTTCLSMGCPVVNSCVFLQGL